MILERCLTNHVCSFSDAITLWILPQDWREKFQVSGLTGLILLMAVDVFGLRKFGQVGHITDNVSHLAGYVVGIVSGWWWNQSHNERDTTQRKARIEDPPRDA